MTDSYLSIFLSGIFSKEDPQSLFSLILLFLSRMLPIIAMSPFFGARVLPNPTKVMLGFVLFVVFLPTFLLSVSSPLTFNPALVLLAFKEMFVGLILGFLIGIPFVIVQSAGMFIDHQRGGASLMVNDPTIQNQSSPIGTLFNQVLIVVFYATDAPFLFLDAIQVSYDVIPADKFLNPALFTKDTPFWNVQVKLFNEVMVIAVRLASPALIAILMTDVFLGVANRLAPQVQITFLGMPLKSLLGLALIFFGWHLMTSEFAKQSLHWVQVVIDVIKMFGVPNA